MYLLFIAAADDGDCWNGPKHDVVQVEFY